MKKRMIWKSTFREIRQTFGRFFAILAIVALGVGFFAGLKVAKPSMLRTAEHYFAESGFYDYRLLSTLGFEQEDVDYLGRQEDVENAEGAVSFDILYQTQEGNEGVVKAHSITDHVNQLKVLEGRLPQSGDECVIDANLFGESLVGQRLKLSENNTEEDLEHFAYREYTIVGIVQSPLYVQYERGNTSLGTGKINGFIYLPYDGFNADYFTEVYIEFSEKLSLYSDAYEKYISGREQDFEIYASEAANMRYQRLKADAEEELLDARAEFETQKADGQAELLDAEEELLNASEQIAEGERQLADAKSELQEAQTTIAEKTRELSDAESQIAAKEKELSDGEQKIQDGIQQWNDGKYQLDQAKRQLQEGMDALEIQKETVAAKEKELQAGEAALSASEQALLQKGQELTARSAELDAAEQALKEQYGDAIPEELSAKLQAARDQLAAYQEELQAGFTQIAEKRQEIESGKTMIAQGKAAIAVYEQQLDEAGSQIKEGDKGLADSQAQINQGKQELADGRAALEDAKKQVEEGRQELADAARKLTEGEKTLSEKEDELADAREAYEEGLEEYADGAAEFQERIADAEKELADAEQEIEDLEEPETYLLGRDTNIGYVCFDNDTSIVAGIANIFPVFFFLVAALVCITTMNRMVEEQRTQIGVLKALGYSDGVIMWKYLFYSGAAAVVGCVLGFAAGTYFFPRIIWEAYGIMYRMESLSYVFDWRLAVISLAVALFCSVGTTWLSCRVELLEVAAQLMRPKSPKAGKRVFLEYLPFLWKRMSFLRKVSFRNIFRYKRRLFMMVLGISGCTALLVAAFGIEDSIAKVADQQFGEIQLYDLNVSYAEEVSGQETAALEQVTGAEPEAYSKVCETTFDLVEEEGRKAVNVVVFEEGTDLTPFVNLHTKAGDQIDLPGEGEVVLTDKIADTYGLKVGDRITLQNEEMEKITAEISGISQNFIYNYAYINSKTYLQETGKNAEYKNIYVNLSEDAKGHETAAELLKKEHVTGVTVTKDTLERFSSMMRSLDLIVVVVILCAAGLAFIVLYNLTNINITERIREIATIKVLGFRKKETASYVFRENMLLAAMGIAAGLFLGHCLHRFIMHEINIELIAFDVHVRPVSYLYSVLLTFLFTVMINRFMNRKLDRISMTESLKSVD